MTECLFCKIATGEIPASIVHQNDRLVAFRDINPQAPLHILIIPLRHIATLNDLTPKEEPLVGEMIQRAVTIAREQGYAENGYRIALNCNRDAGQSVFHIHVHLLAGRSMSWPPG